MYIYTHGYTHFASEEHARRYTEEHIKHSKDFYEEYGHVCSNIVETVKHKGNKEIHIFSFTYPDSYNQRKIAKISTRYTIQKLP